MLKVGKLDSALLEKLVFQSIRHKRTEVLKRPGIGEDCAVIDFGAYDCIVSTDPITAAVDQIGRLAVHISCNDIAAEGVEPLGLLMAIMLPEGTTEAEIATIMRQAGETAGLLGVEIIGGHTEITQAVRQPVVVSTAIGRAPARRDANTEKAAPGDLIYMTKSAGLEGSGILAHDYEKALIGKLSSAEIQEAKSYLEQISVVKEGVAAGKTGVVAMHDVTEGGLLGAIWELCYVAGTGAEIWQEAIPLSAVTEKICAAFDLDPLRLISSGCMVIVVRPEKKDALEKALAAASVNATPIGMMREAADGLMLVSAGAAQAITPPESDELYKVVGRD